VNHGTQYIRQYAGKNITGATAGLAYNLGLAPAAINAAGICAEDIGNDDDAGVQNYNFNDRGNFVAGAGGLNLAKYVHYKLRAYNPVTGIA
jgi:hypothetical protein